MNRKIVLNADDFGLTKYHNMAVLKGYNNGVLAQASLMVNTESFSEAVEDVMQNCARLNLGLHLNIMEGKALTDCYLLTDKNGFFNKNYLYLMLNQYNKKLKEQIEKEFRAQIEKALQHGIKIDRLDSHVHTHAIPELFKITCKLAKEYGIGYVRTQFEKPYFVFPDCINTKFPINLIKVALLDYFTLINRKTINEFNLKTNDNIIGVCYTGMMNRKTVLEGIKKNSGSLVEIVIHPCFYDDGRIDSHTKEFLITQDKAFCTQN